MKSREWFVVGVRLFGVWLLMECLSEAISGAEVHFKMLTLRDEKSRRFDADRWCFLGSIDDWYYLDGGKTLDELVKKYVPHLGKESFFELA